MTITAATATADITPDISGTGHTYMAGYGADTTPRVATGARDRLRARCVVLREGANTKGVVSLDVVALSRAWHQALRPSLDALVSGWSVADLPLLASHTHNGPALSVPHPYTTHAITSLTSLTAYESWLATKVVEVVSAALAAPAVTVSLDYGYTSQNWAYNRAGLTFSTETTVPVLCARKSDGDPHAVLFGYAAHPVAAGVQTRWDGDYAAAAAATIEGSIPGCTALFVPGGMGDHDPTGTRNWGLRDRLGAQLGAAVVTKATTAGRNVGMPTSEHTDVTVPLDLSVPISTFRAGYVARQSASPYAWERRHGEEMVAQIDAGTYATSVHIPLTVWKFPSSPLLRWGFTAGEIVSAYTFWARANWGGFNGIVLGGNANEVPFYLTGQQFFPPQDTNGSYEGGWRTDYSYLGGHSMSCYAHVAHFKGANVAGQSIEPIVVAALTDLFN